jgi:protein ImuB
MALITSTPMPSDSRARIPALVGGRAALRLLETPEAVEVECLTGEAPRAVWWRGRRITIDQATGPERLSGDWWKDGYRRDYWRCESEGSELVVFSEAGTQGTRWYVQGWYD